jgi:hypothetical protein
MRGVQRFEVEDLLVSGKPATCTLRIYVATWLGLRVLRDWYRYIYKYTVMGHLPPHALILGSYQLCARRNH